MHTFLLVIYLTLSISEQCYQVRLTLMRREGQGWGVRGWLCSSFLRGGWAAEPEPLTSSSQTHLFKGFGLACAQPLLARAQVLYMVSRRSGAAALYSTRLSWHAAGPWHPNRQLQSDYTAPGPFLMGLPRPSTPISQSTTFLNNAHPSLSLLWSKHIGHFVSQIISGCLPIPSGLCLFSVRSLSPTLLRASTCPLSQHP